MDSTNVLSEDTYTCSLCCEEIFHSKAELIEHLALLLSKLSCPICKDYFSSLQRLIDHLIQNVCDTPDIQIKFGNGTQMEHSETLLPNFQSGLKSRKSQIEHASQADDGETNSDIEKMYGEYLPKGQTTPEICISQSHNNQYIILAQDDLSEAVVTKNNDGTISLTSLQAMKKGAEPTLNQTKSESNPQSDMEVYSCNTCGVSFTSVLEHIQTYHKHEKVVVEEPVDDNVAENISVQDNQISRRVITDTGDIVEETESQQAIVNIETIKQEAEEMPKRQLSKRYIKVEKLCDSVVKNIKQEKKTTDYHKVVVKQVKTTKGTIKIYNCIRCNVYVSSLNELTAKQCKKLKYQCPHCDVAYENSKSLCAHMKVHKMKKESTDVKVTFDCKICNTNFPTNKSLKLHMRMHAPVKIRQIEPPLNTGRGETSNDKFLCSVCDKLIPIDYRTIHQNSHKMDGDKLNCGICNKKFTTPEYLKMHMGVHNLDRVTLNNPDKELPYNCLYCHRQFARPHEKVKHERIHTGEKPHSCEICGKSFRVLYCLTLHMRTHTGARPYACPHCAKRFKAHSVYNHHLLTHSEVRAYKCPFCPKAFKTLVQLAGHKNSHTKPFSCQQCNRPFASLYAVRVHTETHNKQNNLKFSCKHCGASYARVSALKDHIKQTHNVNETETTEEMLAKIPTTNVPADTVLPEEVSTEVQTMAKNYEMELDLAANELIV